MITQLTQENITEYASEAQTIQEPTGTDYTQGVRVGKTIPAKWWNWLFSAVTKRITQSRTDADNMLTELKNAVTDAGLTPTGSDNTQLAQAVDTKANAQLNKYIVSNKYAFTLKWDRLRIIIEEQEYNSATFFYNLQYVNSVTLGMVIFAGSIFVGSTSYYNYFSLDGIHWQKSGLNLTDASESINKTNIVCMGDVAYKISSNSSSGVTIIRSNLVLSPLVTENVFSEETAGAYQPFMSIINGIIYFMTSQGLLYKISNTGVIELVGDVHGLEQNAISASYRAGVVLPTYIGQRCFVGNIEVNGDIWTPMYNFASADLCANNINSVVPKKLHNGNIIFIPMYDYYAPSANIHTMVVDTLGGASAGTNISFVISNLDAQTDIVVRFSSDVWQYSSDGFNFTSLPSQFGDATDAPSFAQVGEWYVFVRQANENYNITNSVYSIHGLPTSNINDYTPVKQETWDYSVVHLRRYALYGYLLLDNSGGYWIVDTDCVLTQVYPTGTIIPNTAVWDLHINGDIAYFLQTTFAQKYLCVSKNTVNRVAGHTLYLR